MVYLLKMVIFHSYVKLPEGTWNSMEHVEWYQNLGWLYLIELGIQPFNTESCWLNQQPPKENNT